ncbi:serine/threonine-protein phosphatase PGAM5, mitochondrial-like [Amphibalanus amphitrite]|uniref:serine/threonine-protein phosphatase PGAM5, mitochondrial-like n=1 Tax=Amphibalanus amphitrite TaxID=1232801 RepID=UPI001C90732E|nr:serine/threonine-protein phosphatase PGAM5, mitochondrial-like [Amphibalanus amphitrite]XP_043211480.1 serine/threonine-protein phosphatase PGAM5, mitochondrial-like [Amphibalanus amphitrite]XP_043211481.1 serine/threonine-protein phosphatase PGAM5, mitochondrial-like [Amphibalanus amphitrite]XP_043211482.1 serine/threonine-protein phosphatase PGAM5, mitochondrial-like [Amphibalanus amphitrite]XP_043211483.1 serine/threonine-protein phosphatase PGAM5, mitochondrial-like [Amphibalanus amphitr
MASAGARVPRLVLVGLGALGGGSAVLLLKPGQKPALPTEPGRSDDALPLVSYSAPDRFSGGIAQPTTKWDSNWDQRAPTSLVEPPKGLSEAELKDHAPYQESLSKAKAKARRHLILIRHGQYQLDGATDEQRVLTELGRQQAALTGAQLRRLGLPYTAIIRSSMSRALETSDIIHRELAEAAPPVSTSDLLREGAPIPPEPRLRHWQPGPRRFYEDGPRIEAAFRRFVHRAAPDQERDSYEIVVCHANVIRYFVCRALQLPPEAWLRFSLRHASLTWLTVLPNGRVKLDFMGDAGFMPPEAMTTT